MPFIFVNNVNVFLNFYYSYSDVFCCNICTLLHILFFIQHFHSCVPQMQYSMFFKILFSRIAKSYFLDGVFHEENSLLDVESAVLRMRETETGAKVYVCTICNKAFSIKSQFQYHVHSHTKPFTCEYCQKRFSRVFDLKRHWRIHTGQKPYTCNLCDYTARFHSALKSHLEKKHHVMYTGKKHGKKQL